MLATIGVALVAAVCFAANGVFQHYAAASTARAAVPWTRMLLRPTWWFGSAAGVAGVVLQVLALGSGPVVLVQPVLATSVVFALPASFLIHRRTPSLAECGWGGLLIAALAAFLVAARPAAADTDQVNETALLANTIVLVAIGAGAVAWALHQPGHRRAMVLGGAAGAGYGLASVLGKECLRVLTGSGPVQVLGSWPFWALLLIIGASVGIAQAAFRAGPLSASMPPLAILDPLVGVTLGVTSFSETLSSSPGALIGQLVAGVAMAAAIGRLAGVSPTSLPGDRCPDESAVTTSTSANTPARIHGAGRSR